MHKSMITAAAAILISGCSDGAPEQNNAAATPATLAGGQYEASWKVTELRSIDKTTPATNLKEQASGTSTGCVGADGAIDPALFAEDGDECTIDDSYMRNGRISMSATCRREGQPGEIRQSITGSYTADGLEAEASSTTYFTGAGDYALVRTFTGKRIGECPPALAEDAATNKG